MIVCDGDRRTPGPHRTTASPACWRFPGAVGLFFDLHSPTARTFLRRYPTHADAGRLTETTMAAWLRAEGYCGRTPAATLVQRLRSAPTGLSGAEADARRHVTLALLTSIDTIERRPPS